MLISVSIRALPFRNPNPDVLEDPSNDAVDKADDKAQDLDAVRSSKEDDNKIKVLGDDADDDPDGVDINHPRGDSNDIHNAGAADDLKFKHDVVEKPVNDIPVDKLKPVDHMDAVRLEQDGHINKDVHKELFLGNHEEFNNDKYEEAESKLKDIVYRVDSNHDGQLTVAELEAWVMLKMEEHFSEALQENEEIFKHLDDDKSGKVHWKEYYKHFLEAKGYSSELAAKQVFDYDQINLEGDCKFEYLLSCFF